ncbi:MAG: hypothetical protein IKU07_04400 [Oscillospiraceae bacterium]|nr:hypothetical protein [Oscillospiraceae bacterium]
MNMKAILAFVLALCMVLCLCACGNAAGNTETTPATTEAVATTEATEADDGKVTYTVKVVDEGNNPVAGAMVQLCKETCLPGVTGADGVAVFNVMEDSEYKVSFMSQPAGYEGMEEAYYFEAGSYELTITLTAVS